APSPPAPAREIPEPPAALSETYAGRIATQEAFSRVLSTLSRHPIADFLVTASPDVATSTHLGGWINRRGVYSHQAMIDYFAAAKIARPIQWRGSPRGPHPPPGGSGNNLFLPLPAPGPARAPEGPRVPPAGPGLGVYLRLSTVPIDQGLFPDGRPGLREAVLGGGYRIVDRRREPEYQPEENVVNVFAAGAIVPEAVAASESLRARGILANV